jgi:hypothetical protein
VSDEQAEWPPPNHPLIRAAVEPFGRLMDACGDRIPRRVDIRFDHSLYRHEFTFFAEARGRSPIGFCVPESACADFRSPAELTATLHDLWDKMRRECRHPPRMTVAEGARIAASWRLGDIVEPVPIEYRSAYGGLAGGGMTEIWWDALTGQIRRRQVEAGLYDPPNMTSNAAPPESPPQTLTMQTLMNMVEPPPRPREPSLRERRPTCRCPSCRPDLHRHRDPEEVRAEEFAELEKRFRGFSHGGRDEEHRSITLLRAWMSPDQLAQFQRDRCFDVTGSTGKRYRIYRAHGSNVIELDDKGIGLRGWCFGPAGDAAQWTGDVMLTQMLALQADEKEALGVANLWWRGPPEGWRPQLNPFGASGAPAPAPQS